FRLRRTAGTARALRLFLGSHIGDDRFLRLRHLHFAGHDRLRGGIGRRRSFDFDAAAVFDCAHPLGIARRCFLVMVLEGTIRRTPVAATAATPAPPALAGMIVFIIVRAGSDFILGIVFGVAGFSIRTRNLSCLDRAFTIAAAAAAAALAASVLL